MSANAHSTSNMKEKRKEKKIDHTNTGGVSSFRSLFFVRTPIETEQVFESIFSVKTVNDKVFSHR